MMLYIFYVMYKSGKRIKKHTYEFKDEEEARRFEYKNLKYNEKVFRYERKIRKLA